MKIRCSPVIDGVAFPDFYVDHPNFIGSTAQMTLYAESAPGTTDKYAPTGSGTVSAAGAVPLTKTAATFSPNDSRNSTNYSP